MRNNVIEAHKKTLKLTRRQREILIGTLLGDGHLETQNGGKTHRLKIEHSIRQKEYVDWLYQEFKKFVLTPPQIKLQSVRFGDKEDVYQKYWFNTLSVGVFRFYAQQFYKDGKKIVPRFIHKLLSPLALAVWYMDDGSIKSNAHAAVFLNTHGFDEMSLKRLQNGLFERFGVKTNLRKQKEGTQLYLLSETIDLFQKAIKLLVHPSMKYKLPKIWLT